MIKNSIAAYVDIYIWVCFTYSTENGSGVRNVYSSQDSLTNWNGFLHRDGIRAGFGFFFRDIDQSFNDESPKNSFNIQFLPCISKGSDKHFGIIDHGFMAPTSQFALEDYLNKSRDIFGFYNGKTR